MSECVRGHFSFCSAHFERSNPGKALRRVNLISQGGQCCSAFWAGHCAVHAYLPVVLFCSVLK